jgi:hypothetical protein
MLPKVSLDRYWPHGERREQPLRKTLDGLSFSVGSIGYHDHVESPGAIVRRQGLADSCCPGQTIVPFAVVLISVHGEKDLRPYLA